MVSSGEVSGCWRPIIVRGKSCETSATLRIRKFAGQRCGQRTHCWRRVIRRHRTVHPGSRRKSARQHCLFEPPRQAVSGWHSAKRIGRRTIVVHVGSMSRIWPESHCTQAIGHQLLTDWTEFSEIDTGRGGCGSGPLTGTVCFRRASPRIKIRSRWPSRQISTNRDGWRPFKR